MAWKLLSERVSNCVVGVTVIWQTLHYIHSTIAFLTIKIQSNFSASNKTKKLKMMMNAFWWEFIKMKVKLGNLRIIDLIWYRTMGPASCFQIDDHLLENREKWCFNSGKIHDWHTSWRGVSILVIKVEKWRKRSVAKTWIIQEFTAAKENLHLTLTCIIRNTHISGIIWKLIWMLQYQLISASSGQTRTLDTGLKAISELMEKYE